MASKKRKALIAASALGLGSVALSSLHGPSGAVAGTGDCSDPAGVWHAKGVSGTGQGDWGSAGFVTVPTDSWYQATGTIVESIYMQNPNPVNGVYYGLEAGYLKGYSHNGHTYTKPRYFYTADNSTNEVIGTEIPAGYTYGIKASHTSSHHGRVYASQSDGSYVWQKTPSDSYGGYGTNLASGEVHVGGYLGNGSYPGGVRWYQLQWTDDDTHWYNWGTLNTCTTNSNLWSHKVSVTEFKNGGTE